MSVENSSEEKLNMSNAKFKVLPIPQKRIDRKLVKNNPIIKEIGIPKYLNYEILESCDLAFQRYQKKKFGTMEDGKYKKGKFIHLEKDQQTLRKIYGYKIPDEMQLDVYNISSLFELNGDQILAGRLQPRDSQYYSTVVFFKKSGNKFIPQNKAIQNLEDPFIVKVHGKTILGGVRIYRDKNQKLIDLETLFFEMKDLENFKLLIRGVSRMKDIRLVEMEDKIGLFTRPQGEIGARGQICFIPLDNLEQVTHDNIIGAPTIPLQFPPYQWGGVNEAHFIDGKILALGHRAYWDQEYQARRYYAWMFTLDPKNGNCQDLGIVASTDDFPRAQARSEDLVDVLFPGGLNRLGNGWAELYVGINDTQAGKIRVPFPVL